jgi:hypothetical protein
VEEFGEEVSGSLNNDCRLSRRVAQSSSQSKATDDASLQGIYKLSHSWDTVITTVTMNIPKCVLKGILVQVLGVETLKTCLCHCSSHMLDSNNVN